MSSTHFLNVDLDIRGESGLDELLDAFNPAVIVPNQDGKNFVSLEIARAHPQSVDETILVFCNLVQQLPPEVRAVWDNCTMRCMNIGIQAGTKPHSECFHISGKTISLLSAIKAEIAFTVYAAKSEGSR